MGYRVRRTRREDWQELRELRLAALRDPVAPLAFYEPYDEAASLLREDWERRAAGGGTTTFVGEDEQGAWCGMLSVFDDSGRTYVVGVYLLPEHRGTGLAGELMSAAFARAGDREVRLRVHEHNTRAVRFYRSLGFRPTGLSDPDPRDPSLRAYELALRPVPHHDRRHRHG